ncbi:MAG: hypothetical protein R2825_14280 [Saprospiraceae bacterium]
MITVTAQGSSVSVINDTVGTNVPFYLTTSPTTMAPPSCSSFGNKHKVARKRRFSTKPM